MEELTACSNSSSSVQNTCVGSNRKTKSNICVPYPSKQREQFFHLEELRIMEQAQNSIPNRCSLQMMEQTLLEQGVSGLLNFLQSRAEEESSKEERHALGLIIQTIRFEYRFIQNHPESLFQCLWNQLWWETSPESKHWYSTDSSDKSEHLSDLPFGKVLQTRLQQWGEEKQRQSPGFNWVRSLRPPIHLVGTALLNKAESPEIIWSHSHMTFSKSGSQINMWTQEAVLFEDIENTEKKVRHISTKWDWQNSLPEIDSWEVPNQIPLPEPPAIFRNRSKSTNGRWKIHAHSKSIDPNGVFSDNDLHIVDTQSGKIAITLPIKEQGEHWLHNMFEGIFSPDNQWIAGSGWEWDGESLICLWKVTDAKMQNEPTEVLHYSPGPHIEALSFSPDSQFLVLGFSDRVEIFSTESQKRIYSLTGIERRIKQVALSPNNQILAVVDRSGQLSIWDITATTESPRLRHLQGDLGWSGFSADGHRFYCQPWLWDGHSGKLVKKLNDLPGRYLEGGPPRPNHWIGKDRLFSLDGIKALKCWDLQNGARKELPGIPKAIDKIGGHWTLTALSQNGRWFACGRENSHIAFVFDLESENTKVECPCSSISTLAFSGDGSLLAIGSSDDEGTVAIFDIPSGNELWNETKHSAPITHIHFSKDGKRLVSAARNENLIVWDAEAGKSLGKRPFGTFAKSYSSHTSRSDGTSESKEWQEWNPSDSAIGSMNGWEGFVSEVAEKPYHCTIEEGVTYIVNRDSQEKVASYPFKEELLPHPSGKIWAHPLLHITLEQGFPPGESFDE